MTRRTLLAALTAAATGALAACRGTTDPAPAAGSTQFRYGDDPSQVADLHLPGGTGRVPVVVVVHGGFWRSEYGKDLATPLAENLAAAGMAGCAVEYRRVGNGGGWPATFADVAAAIDALAGPGQQAAGDRLDLDRVVAVGHSAGGHLVTWAAARAGLPAGAPGANPRVRLRGAVSQAGVVDLVDAAGNGLGGGAVEDLMGASPDEDLARYRLASAYERLPIGVPVALVHGTADNLVPIAQSQRYADAARAAGDPVRLVRLDGVGHFELIDAGDDAWAACRREIDRLLAS